MILVISRWFPNKYEPVKCIFTKNIIDAQVKYTKHSYILISPIPYFPKVNLPFLSEKFKNLSRLNYQENGNGYCIYRPKYVKLPHPLSQKWEWYTYFKSVLGVIKKENLRFNLVHSHGLYPDGYVASKIGEYFNIPVIIHLHDSYFNEIYQLYKRKIDQIINCSERIIAVSEFQKNMVTMSYNNYTDKIYTIYNGININNFNVTHYDREKKNKLIFVGNLIDIKGLDILIHALNLLKDDISVSCDIFGDGKNRRKYQDMVNKLGLESLVKFKGFVNNYMLPEIFQKYSFLILPSRYETFGIVLIEAMACGIPVIASKVGAVSEIVTSNEVGILVKPNSPEALAEGIKNAIEKDWDRKQIRDYATKFSIEKTAIEIGNVYDEILYERTRTL